MFFVVKRHRRYWFEGDFFMSVQPKSESFRKAFKWVSDECKFNPGKGIKALVEEACLKFNLSPIEAEFLLRTVCEKK